MLKKRLIFTLLYKNGFFCLSRNFRLQEVGDVNWLLKSFNFASLSEAVDELIILNVGSSNVLSLEFINSINLIQENFFVPMTIGGGIQSGKEASKLFRLGADKISLNLAFYYCHDLCKEIVSDFGSQALVASIDYRFNSEKSKFYAVSRAGTSNESEYEFFAHIDDVQRLGCGELLLRSIQRDGTGMGLDLSWINQANYRLRVPLILSGGIGKAEHILEGLFQPQIDAVATANLLNFIGDGLTQARSEVIQLGANLSLTGTVTEDYQ